MKEAFRQYITNLINNIPITIYVVLILLLCVGMIFFLSLHGNKRKIYSCRLLLFEFIFLLCCSTIIFRSSNNVQGFNFIPFWSYWAIYEGEKMILPENVLNIVVFMPIGLLSGCAFRNTSFRKVALVGCGISFMIEIIQFSLNRGFTELDDVMHNTLGCMIGYGAYALGKEALQLRNKGKS